ncbi:hypothetical protein Poli38472_011727 [Pythium oligandrum]|uniref:PHD-type domain-containing protein n=1 Tax=Pythium oligandrum TaxID=41045 RepID=A0A8K1FEN7_PYTOL|nr:hypothetical protein Poli38472_011727 [Pythium oligandrum]|eukprot:TMW58139.1 hypothetical protein Poli38472_011727 [Pythium oligandrum]
MAPTGSAAGVGWQERYERDPRRKSIETSLQRILQTNFPQIAAKLQHPEPPRQRYEPPTRANGTPSTSTSTSKREESRDVPERQFLDASMFLNESSSEAESMTEIDPMEELQEMEKRGFQPHPKARRVNRPVVPENGDGDSAMDDAELGSVDDDEEETACVVCNRSDNEKSILLCDNCDDEYHLYCLTPALTSVPRGDWFCPQCKPDNEPSEDAQADSVMDGVSRGQSTEQSRQAKREQARNTRAGSAVASSSATSISIAQTFEQNADKTNQLLIHACNCDDAKCQDPTFHEFCPHMKRFLRSACWASHNEKWMTYRIAKVTAELFAYHSLHCQVSTCNVPMCEELRAEEYV